MQPPSNTAGRSRVRVFGAACIAIATACLLVGMLEADITDRYAASRDFIEYWAAGQLLIQHANPYDADATLRIQQAAGMLENDPQITLSPPAASCLLLPLGLVSPKTGLVIWALALIASLLISVWLIWVLNGRPDNAFHLCGYLFAPAVACLMLGQIGTFLLLGVVLFLYLHTRWPYLAGVALLPCVWKPHLFLPFFMVLFLWSLDRRQLRILAGFLGAVIAASAITLHFDPQVWSQYFRMVADTSGRLHGYIPTLSVTLRFLIDPRALWLQYIPEIAVSCWAVWYFFTRRHRWNWIEQGSWLFLASAACTPYSWFTDEAILLPAVLNGVYRAIELRRSLWPIAVIGLAALVEVCALGHIASTHYLWTVPAWLGWYLYATWNREQAPVPQERHDVEVTWSR